MTVYRFWNGETKKWTFSTKYFKGADIAGVFAWVKHPDECPEGKWVYEPLHCPLSGHGAQPSYNWLLMHWPKHSKSPGGFSSVDLRGKPAHRF